MTGDTTEGVAVPKEWPPQVAELYSPIRLLGKGGFGAVMLAKKKRDKKDGDKDVMVAIKVVGGPNATKQLVGYAYREVHILHELSHPHIMRVLQYWEPPPESQSCALVMALSFAQGPTCYQLIMHGGRLSFAFSRVVAAQLTGKIHAI